MERAFFPDPAFGWSFFGLMTVLLLVAAWKDSFTGVVPKWITIPTFFIGILANSFRGGALGYFHLPVWAFGDSGMGLAILDGFLFGLAGGLAGFALFTLMFAVQVVRGGDVKLAAAIGAWLGPYYICWFLLATVIVLPLWFILKLMVVLLNGVMNPPEPNQAQSKKTENASKKSRVTEGKSNTSDTTQPKPSLRVLTFSAPAAISACIVLLWMGRFDLELMNRPKPPEGVANANAATN